MARVVITIEDNGNVLDPRSVKINVDTSDRTPSDAELNKRNKLTPAQEVGNLFLAFMEAGGAQGKFGNFRR